MASAQDFAIDPESVAHIQNVKRLIGHLYFLHGDSDRAKIWLEESTSGPQALLANADLCLLLWDSGRFHEAVEACEAGKVPAQYWLARGARATNANQDEMAIRAYQMAVELEPDEVNIRMQLVILLGNSGRYDKVIQLLGPRLETHPNEAPEPYRELGRAYWILGQNDLALNVLLRGNRYFPDDFSIYSFLGRVYEELGDLKSATYWYDRSLEQQPNQIYDLIHSASIAEMQLDWEKALQFYDRVVTLDPIKAEAWIGLGRASEAIGFTDLAISAYERVLELRGKNWFAEQRLEELR